jgi:hypothetical protein
VVQEDARFWIIVEVVTVEVALDDTELDRVMSGCSPGSRQVSSVVLLR